MLKPIISMAQVLHLPVIVEGVETKEDSQYLASIGCDYAQGYYYGKPAPCSILI